MGTYDEGLWMLLGGAFLLAASIVLLCFSVKKLKTRTTSNKTPFISLIISIVVLCASSVGILVAIPLASDALEVPMTVLCAVLMAAAIVGIVLSAIKLKKKQN